MARHNRVVACVLAVWCLCGLVSAFDYKDALAKSILFFEGQRAGKLSNCRVAWRGDSALSDGKNEGVNLTGGYYDAGDNVKFGWPMAYSVSLLSWAAIEFQQQIASANQLAFLQGAIRWGTDFILASHPNPTTLYTQVGDGNSDHACWERPEDMDTPRNLIKITSSSPGSEAAAEAAAALASASIVFKKVDSAYSSKLLKSSISLFDLADKYKGSYQASCPFYCSHSGYQDELLWAAAWLYKATGNKLYLSYVESNQGWSNPVNEFSWDNKFAGAQTLLAKEFYAGNQNLAKYKANAEAFVCAVMPGSTAQIKRTPGGLLFIRDASNLQYATSATLAISIYSKTISSTQTRGVQCGSTFFSSAQVKAFAKSQVDYILGANPKKMSYMVGFGNTFPTKPHHRSSSIPSIKKLPTKVDCKGGHTYLNSGSPNPNTHVGAIVGGPDGNDQYPDSRTDYAHAEPTTYINAAFVGAVASCLA